MIADIACISYTHHFCFYDEKFSLPILQGCFLCTSSHLGKFDFDCRYCPIFFFIILTFKTDLILVADIVQYFSASFRHLESILFWLPILPNIFLHYFDILNKFDFGCRYCKIFFTYLDFLVKFGSDCRYFQYCVEIFIFGKQIRQ